MCSYDFLYTSIRIPYSFGAACVRKRDYISHNQHVITLLDVAIHYLTEHSAEAPALYIYVLEAADSKSTLALMGSAMPCLLHNTHEQDSVTTLCAHARLMGIHK
jgi:hypothetical protein